MESMLAEVMRSHLTCDVTYLRRYKETPIATKIQGMLSRPGTIICLSSVLRNVSMVVAANKPWCWSPEHDWDRDDVEKPNHWLCSVSSCLAMRLHGLLLGRVGHGLRLWTPSLYWTASGGAAQHRRPNG